MPDLSVKSLKADARLFLASGPTNYAKLTLIYLAFLLGAQVIAGLVSFVCSLILQNTGGLSAVNTEIVLETVVTLVGYAVQICAPIWAIGYTHCTIGLARQDPMEPQHLTEGFYRFWVLFRLALAQGFVYMICLSLVSSLSTSLFLMLPGGMEAMVMAEPYANDPALVESMTQAEMLKFLGAMWPLLAIIAVLGAIVLIPLFYGYRMCNYRVMDNEYPGALLTIAQSRRMMKGTRWQLFKLDISFWWYYLLQLLISALTFVSWIPIPGWDSHVLMLCCLAVQCLALFLLDYKCMPRVQTTYAVFYDRLLQYHKERAQQQREAFFQNIPGNPFSGQDANPADEYEEAETDYPEEDS